jgi:hypothetical protein
LRWGSRLHWHNLLLLLLLLRLKKGLLLAL